MTPGIVNHRVVKKELRVLTSLPGFENAASVGMNVCKSGMPSTALGWSWQPKLLTYSYKKRKDNSVKYNKVDLLRAMHYIWTLRNALLFSKTS